MTQHHFALQIKNLSKTMKGNELLQPLNYELPKGKILALCGGNGAGKSTLIRLILGLIKPTTGYALLNGKNKKNDKMMFLTQFGYMPDDFNFNGVMTAKETITFYGMLKQVEEKRYEEIIETVGLTDRLHDKVNAFSKGMRQRLLFAQALIAKPSIIILDEPTNGLDPYWINRFAEIIVQAKENGQTIIFSTHDLYVAEQVADHVIFLNDGHVISKGAIEEYKTDGLYKTFEQLYFHANDE